MSWASALHDRLLASLDEERVRLELKVEFGAELAAALALGEIGLRDVAPEYFQVRFAELGTPALDRTAAGMLWSILTSLPVSLQLAGHDQLGQAVRDWLDSFEDGAASQAARRRFFANFGGVDAGEDPAHANMAGFLHPLLAWIARALRDEPVARPA